MKKEITKIDDFGWISLHRKIINNPIFNNSDGLKIWIWCLVKAKRFEDDILLGRKIIHLKNGQFIFGRLTASEQLNIPGSTVVFWMDYLKHNSYLDIKTTNKYSIITVLNFKEYQKVDSKVDSRKTTDGQQKDTNNKEDKENKVDNNTYSKEYVLGKNVLKEGGGKNEI